MSDDTTAAGGCEQRYGNADEADIDELMQDALSSNTKKSTKYAIKTLYDYCNSKGYNPEFESKTVNDLNNLLKEFYVNVRRANGEHYTRSSLSVIRQSINRHLKQPPHNKTFDIINGIEFKTCNDAFKAMCKKLRKEGKGQVKHKRPVDKGDIKKLYDHPRVFNVETPQGLLNKVFFEILLYFCRRGQEDLRDLRPDLKEYIRRTSSEVTKNHQGVDDEDYEPEGGRMYATVTPRCPVTSFKKYLEKRNQNNTALWQRPRNSFDENDSTWFEKQPIGKNTLGCMMSNISKAAKLSKIYTNHCVRATCITVLSESGFEARHIVIISGHRNEQSVRNYVRDTSTAQKRDMSVSISSFTEQSDVNNSSTSSNQTKDDDQHNGSFDNEISDNDLVMTAAQYDTLIESISREEAELQPLHVSDSTNQISERTALPDNPKRAIIFSNCQVTIHAMYS